MDFSGDDCPLIQDLPLKPNERIVLRFARLRLRLCEIATLTNGTAGGCKHWDTE